MLLGQEHREPLALAGEGGRQPDDAPADDEHLGLEVAAGGVSDVRELLLRMILVHGEPSGHTMPSIVGLTAPGGVSGS